MTESTLGHRVSGRRAGQRFDAENGVVTEALLFLGDLDPEAIGPNIEHATHYEPTPVGDLDRLLAHVPFALSNATFVDIGAGMGRAMLLAAAHPFRSICGVEISPALYEVARDNLRKAPLDEFKCRDLRIACGDAIEFKLPKGDLVAYMYNPFDGTIVRKMMQRFIEAATTRQVALVYHTPVEREALESSPAFELTGEETFGAVYRIASDASKATGPTQRSSNIRR